ncbi:kinesin-domain-containing protein [Saccharata proteae CBS 121410]|uniref:Kinesin-domain-containing protein n=1 Tax=Saccharata proteae CBS 121410 TaxID=1314787 RepID=A0A9P4HQA8_9PEZI|nr:kinesin-domain-containing protein [Saccharata proteae CBS 121410]
MASPPASPAPSGIQRPMSAMIRSNRSSSRMSMSSRQGGSRASDEDGKTAVKVAVRVRPPLKSSDPGFELIPQRFRDSRCQVTTPTSLAIDSGSQGRKLFVFDRVFGEDVDQEGVWEYLSESVASFLQGYNVSILAYGQSGAGKSYTMGTSGPQDQDDPKVMGVVPRAAAALFEQLTGAGTGSAKARSVSGSGLRAPTRYSTHTLPSAQSLSKDKNWQLTATYVEIYNEHLRDLLVPDTVSQSDRATVSIREDTKGRILLTGLQQVQINSIEDLLGALNFGSSIRQTDSTKVNAQSSRSHAVFSLNLIQRKARSASTPTQEKRRSVPLEAMSPGGESLVTVDSKLHFVDLAGSERLKNTGAQGERAREGISINAGLASLGKVISQLSSRSAGAHVSYRDSKLTRLLQDSLGGNAITYMVACVNPAEFHLSETLNTVQYAQRARAIQSKPQIQQQTDDSDKQAVIERLRAEVSFLRDQIRLSERTRDKDGPPQERAERQQEREMELQNKLLDMQENYNALSQRHANIISEITKARDSDSAETPVLSDTLGDSAVERLKRSNSFAEAVEQVVLEYEKTIQSLEASLSTTRSSLSSTESTLLEKETKIAYMESMNQQLQARIQKAMEREANSENYLRDLEARVDGITSGEEKNSSVIQDLRKELARVRESEAGAEEYITTLEERLAEADHDQEMMKAELNRLALVVERQRGVNKLDSLLHELDHSYKEMSDAEKMTNGHGKMTDGEGEEATGKTNGHSVEHEQNRDSMGTADQDADTVNMPQSPEQSRFVNDKLDIVTRELCDLQMTHNNTETELHELREKYQLALHTLAELQEVVDEARHGNQTSDSSRPTSFLAHAGVNGIQEDGGQPSSSRTLSSELSLLRESGRDSLNTNETSDAETALKGSEAEAAADDGALQSEHALAQEVEKLKRLEVEREEQMSELSRNYSDLQERHKETLDHVEDLKSEYQKAITLARPDSPTHIIRRKSSQNIMAMDRANRACQSLQGYAQYFEDQPDISNVFELNLSTIMTELHARTQRVAQLEADIAAVRREMEGKMSIISGLTRERSSLKASSPLDISVVSKMQNQLVESENTMQQQKEAHVARERELQEQIELLRMSIDRSPTSPGIMVHKPESGEDSPTHMPGEFLETPMPEVDSSKQLGYENGDDVAHQQQIALLQNEIFQWKSKHNSTLEQMKASEEKLQATIAELEASLRSAETLRSQQSAPSDQASEGATDVEALKREIDEHKATAAISAARLAELEQSHANILAQVDDDTKARELTERELDTHRTLVSNLEHQLEEHKAQINLHQQGLDTLKDKHAEELAASNEKLTAQIAEHQEATLALHEELSKSRGSQEEGTIALQSELEKSRHEMVTLLNGLSAALNEDIDTTNAHLQVEKLVEERKSLLDKHDKATADLAAAREELEEAQAKISTLESKVGELSTINEETLKELQEISEKEKKSSRLVEELEDQLNSNYDSHQMANNRLSALQTERQVQLEEAVQAKSETEIQLEESRARIAELELQLGGLKRNSNRESLDPRDASALQRSNSNNSNLRKSASHTSLPSPPPAIPLPPLPGSPPATGANPMAAAMDARLTSSPPSSRHQSKDIAQAQLVEDQEARIRTIEKHLFAEKQLTATLEEALTDLEASSTKVKGEVDGWKKKCDSLEEELVQLRQQQTQQRYSLQALEEERQARTKVEAERAHLQARMAALHENNKKKKKSALNCF